MDKIIIMISSVNTGLEGERDALKECFSSIPYVELIGSAPFNTYATATSSAFETIEMAKRCDIYMLILAENYGMEILGEKSATEAEYDAAIRDDPTKIMIFLKDCNISDPKQNAFIKKATDYYAGYFRPKFMYPHQLQGIAMNSFIIWLKDRAQLGKKTEHK